MQVCALLPNKNPINFQYYISNSKIELVSDFKYLGIIFDTKLNFSLHSEMIKNKAMRNLGFIKRTCGSLSNPIPRKLLNCSIVHSNLEYFPLVWLNKIK